MLCTEIVSDIQNNFCTQHVLPMFCKMSFLQRFTCKGSNICGLTPELLMKLQINAIFMSPPCQPFTRQGNQKDIGDNRSEPFLHIVQQLLPNVQSLNYILLENVKGFEKSKAHEILVKTLSDCDFKYQEFLICPKQLGIPNSRMRYYLIATKNQSFKQGDHLISDYQTLLQNEKCFNTKRQI